MKTNPLFTIVVSGYQNAPYLAKSLTSLTQQSFRDFEVFCFVEKSTDNSLEICQSFSQQDDRIKTVSAPKSGSVAATRNYGIEHASGEYLLAIDGDDWVSTEMLNKIALKLKQTGPLDILAFAGQKMVEKKNGELESSEIISNFTPLDTEDIFSGIEAIRRVSKRSKHFANFTPLNLYRTSFLRENNLYQIHGRILEDYEWTPRVFFFAKQVAYLDDIFYFYRIREGSVTNSMMTSPSLLDIPFQIRKRAAFSIENNVPADVLSFWSNQWFEFLFWILFQPDNVQKITKQRRVDALRILFENNGRSLFSKIMRYVARPKRLAFPFLLLGAKGWLFPADCFFNCFYYPVSKWREKIFRRKRP